ncbi:MAG TPA: serine/threonine protein kinase [Pyrinomonadaceae bacterium]|jgi:serine/threonine protein kinase|nr:serine/threonine protein kinase [Pyrinomonadaceae bacterium]
MSELKLQQCRLDGRYDVLDCLGRGSYSEVYVARDSAASNGQPHTVVIKALNTYLQGMPDPELERTLVENFRNEAVALDRVRHPNIISRLGHGTAIDLQGRTFHYLVLEYLPGGDLQAFVRNHPLPLEGALFYLEQVCNGLAHAHKNGVIHRDIKPQNLLLTADQHTVKIADFGVAKIEAAEGAITRVGTDLYAAPEHHPLLQTGPLDTASLNRRVPLLTPAADVYSLAKTTYMLLTGEAPRRFSQKHIDSLPPTLFAQPWAQYVLRVLERATEADPRRRIQTVEEFWREIKDATMAQTRPLRGGGEGEETPRPRPERPPEGAKSTAPPPAPVFDREGRAAGSSKHHRIVVPIAGEGQAQPTVRAGHPTAAPARREDFLTEFDEEPREDRRSSRLRNILVALALLLAFSGMLYATYRYVNRIRGQSGGGGQQQSGGTSQPASPAGREFLTTTDVNLRDGPDSSYPKVGLAERGSRVKVLQASGKWYQIQVVERGRPKEDPASADEGWAHSGLLRAR